jgi:hypothetical protein
MVNLTRTRLIPKRNTMTPSVRNPQTHLGVSEEEHIRVLVVNLTHTYISYEEEHDETLSAKHSNPPGCQ